MEASKKTLVLFLVTGVIIIGVIIAKDKIFRPDIKQNVVRVTSLANGQQNHFKFPRGAHTRGMHTSDSIAVRTWDFTDERQNPSQNQPIIQEPQELKKPSKNQKEGQERGTFPKLLPEKDNMVEKIYLLKVSKEEGSNAYYLGVDGRMDFLSKADIRKNKLSGTWCAGSATENYPSTYSITTCIELLNNNKALFWTKENSRIVRSYEGIWSVVAYDEIEVRLLLPREFNLVSAESVPQDEYCSESKDCAVYFSNCNCSYQTTNKGRILKNDCARECNKAGLEFKHAGASCVNNRCVLSHF